MSYSTWRVAPIIAVLALGACANQSEPPALTYEPIFNKVGGVSGCMGSDGVIYPPSRSDFSDPTHIGVTQPDPIRYDPCGPPPPDECEETYVVGAQILECPPPEDCPEGFFDPNGTYICPDPDRHRDGGNDDSSTGREPEQPSNPVGSGPIN